MALPVLYPFQKDGVKRIWELMGRVLLCDEVGLGKTIQALTYFIQNSTARPGIVVCPATLKINWQREAARFGIQAVILEGKRPTIRWFGVPELFIINYDILEEWSGYLRSINPQILIIDEAQMIVGIRSKRSKQSSKLSRGIPHALLLSGTPIVNKHLDLFPLLNILDPKEFDSLFSFAMEYCVADENRGQIVFKDSVNGKKLNRILNEGYMIRRTKEEVLKDLPPLTRSMLPFDIERRAEYNTAERDFLSWLASWDLVKAQAAARAVRFTKFSYLKRLAADCKMNSVFEWIDNFLANSDGKLILGALHRQNWPHTIQRLDERYPNSISVHGGKSHQEKQDAVDKFQKDKNTRIITLQLKSGGVGLNLQGKKRSMAVIEYPWTPGDVAQFIGRGHRIGTVDPVHVYFLTAAATIEEKIVEIIQKKAKIQNITIDGGRGKSLNLLDELQEAMLKSKGSISKKRKP